MEQVFDDIFPPWLLRLVVLLTAPLRAPLEPGTLFHWPFLLSTLVIGFAVFAATTGKGPLGFWRKYFNAGVWWHASARADYRYYLVNGALFPLMFAPFFAVSSLVAGGVRDLIGTSAEVGAIGWGATLLYSIGFFVAYDFGRYVGHFVQHKNLFLWEFHKIHHSAEVLTPFTSFRLHPVDLLFMSITPGLCTGVVTGLAAVFWGADIGFYTVLSMHVGIAAYHAISNLRHTQIWVSYGPVLSRILISPAQHQIHHSAAPRHFHKNIGWALALWDGVFGTLYVPERDENIVYGLGDGSDGEYHGVVRMYVLPFAKIWQNLRTKS